MNGWICRFEWFNFVQIYIAKFQPKNQKCRTFSQRLTKEKKDGRFWQEKKSSNDLNRHDHSVGTDQWHTNKDGVLAHGSKIQGARRT
jgi:hypothetical protein